MKKPQPHFYLGLWIITEKEEMIILSLPKYHSSSTIPGNYGISSYQKPPRSVHEQPHHRLELPHHGSRLRQSGNPDLPSRLASIAKYYPYNGHRAPICPSPWYHSLRSSPVSSQSLLAADRTPCSHLAT